MANDEKKVDPTANPAGAVPEPAPKPEETKDYILKDGASHSYIKGGEFQTVTGNGRDITVPLTDSQAANFADKLAPHQDVPPAADVTTFQAGHETGGALTIPEGAAQQGAAQGITSDSTPPGNDAIVSGTGPEQGQAPTPTPAESKPASAPASSPPASATPVKKS
jgi:hypothetical protein